MREVLGDGTVAITLRTNAVYKTKDEMEEPVYAYIRECGQREIGFSVKGEIEENPDFTGCGIFWLSPADFDDFFEEV